jgi:Zn-dependent peptidase ImmA (M78 family)
LAAALSFPVEFFQGSDVEGFPLGAVSFRAMSKMTAGTRDAALAAGRIALLINEWLEARFQLPRPDVPTLGLQSPETAAEMVRTRWGLGYAPIPNMVHLLESKGVRVFSLPPECRSVDAYSLRWFDTPVVVLTPGKSSERRRFDLAHELGHLVLHAEQEGFQGPTAEREANRFASAFLMPRRALLARPLRNASLDAILRERTRWKVAAMALTYRLKELGFLSDWEYRHHCVALSRLGYRRAEPGGCPGETSLLLAKVLQALRAKKILLADVAAELNITYDELAQHLAELVVMPVATDDMQSAPTPRGTGHLRLA